jgi:hypothetical protein
MLVVVCKQICTNKIKNNKTQEAKTKMKSLQIKIKPILNNTFSKTMRLLVL